MRAVAERRAHVERRSRPMWWGGHLVSFVDLDGPGNDGQILFTKWMVVVVLVIVGIDVLARDAALLYILIKAPAHADAGGSQLTWVHAFLFFSCIVAAFGRKHLDAWLNRLSVSFGGSANTLATTASSYARQDINIVSKAVTEAITSRRDLGREDGTEPA